MKYWAAILGVSMAVLAACSASPDSTASPYSSALSGRVFVVKCDSFASEADMTASASLKVGEVLVVTLCDEGVLWPDEATIDDPTFVSQDGPFFFRTEDVSSDGVPLQAETWSFTAIGPGQTTILFQASPTDWTYRLVVSVE